MKNINLPHVDNSFLNNPKIQEVEEEEMDNYNIINVLFFKPYKIMFLLKLKY